MALNEAWNWSLRRGRFEIQWARYFLARKVFTLRRSECRAPGKKIRCGRGPHRTSENSGFYWTAGREALPVALIEPVQINGLPPSVPEPLPLVILAVRVSV
jgi:hypothetical protein